MPARPARVALLVALAAPVTPVAAQQWLPGSAVPLVERAARVRTARDSDSLLAGWQAVASGTVRFAVVVGHGSGSLERVIRADQLRVEVYGEAPNRSKQEIVAWRDSITAPTRVVYHRDHLGIVANDFGPLIRLGQGDEVRDVPHPLSTAGLAHYEFRSHDTITVSGLGQPLRVVAVDVRPREAAAAGTVGTLFLDVERAATVRFRFTFTAASYRDPTVDAITVELENTFLDGARWLPWRQAITIRREGPVLALPIQTLLRADWIIDDYRLGIRHPDGRFQGPLVGGLREPGAGTWDASLDTAFPGQAPTIDELDAILGTARNLAPESRLGGLPAVRLLGARGLSSLLHVNRVQGVTLGAGATIAIEDRHQLDVSAALGGSDHRLTGRIELTRRQGPLTMALTLAREMLDVADGNFGSGFANSIATVVDGADGGSWVLREHLIGIDVRGGGGARPWAVGVSRERLASATTRFRALDGTQRPNPALGIGTVWRPWASLAAPGRDPARGWRLDAEVGFGAVDWGRAALALAAVTGPFRWRLEAGIGTRLLPGYRSFLAGGRGTLVGVAHRSIGGRRLLRAEVALPVAVGVPVPASGWLSRGVLSSHLTPFVAAAVAGGNVAGVPWRADHRVQPVLGIRLDLWGPLLRIEAGWAPRQGSFGLSLDAHPDWWPML